MKLQFDREFRNFDRELGHLRAASVELRAGPADSRSALRGYLKALKKLNSGMLGRIDRIVHQLAVREDTVESQRHSHAHGRCHGVVGGSRSAWRRPPRQIAAVSAGAGKPT